MTTAAPHASRRNGILALDVGDARIGLAVSESGVIATPLEALDRRQLGRKGTLDALEDHIGRLGVGTVVIGLPLLESGAEGDQAEKTRAFGRSLSRRLPHLQIHYLDERYTTAEAREILGPGTHAPGRVDSVAAAILLKEYLDSHGKSPNSG